MALIKNIPNGQGIPTEYWVFRDLSKQDDKFCITFVGWMNEDMRRTSNDPIANICLNIPLDEIDIKKPLWPQVYSWAKDQERFEEAVDA